MEVAYLNSQTLSLLEGTEANHAVPNLLTIHVAFSRQSSRALQSLSSPAKFKFRSGDSLLFFFIVFLVQGKIGTLCEKKIRPAYFHATLNSLFTGGAIIRLYTLYV